MTGKWEFPPANESFSVETFAAPGRFIVAARARELSRAALTAKYMKSQGRRVRIVGPMGGVLDAELWETPLTEKEKELLGQSIMRRIGP
jgi:hypothetical protein